MPIARATILFASLMLVAAPASARRCADVEFSPTTEVNGETLVLNGLGLREVTVFNVNVYVADLVF
ncbi:MAG: chalcone isomerase family protein [Myxococcota bacterium]